MTQRYVSTKEAAQILGVSKSYLEKARTLGVGDSPPWVRLGKRVLYGLDDLAADMAARRERSAK